jgi:hypothetical protein
VIHIRHNQIPHIFYGKMIETLQKKGEKTWKSRYKECEKMDKFAGAVPML